MPSWCSRRPPPTTPIPAFSKLFVETEYVRRARHAPRHPAPALAGRSADLGGALRRGRRRDRGRDRVRDRPRPLHRPRPRPGARRRRWTAAALSNTVGTVLDPVFSLRRRVRVPPGATVRVTFWTIVAASREERHRRSPRTTTTPGLRARRDARLDARAGAAPPHRPHARRRRACSRRSPAPCSISEPGAPRLRRRARPRRSPERALGARHLRRPADRAGPHRRRRGHRPRAPAASSPTSTGA